MSHNNSSVLHMEKGSHVHKMIEFYLGGILNEETLDPSLQPYLCAFKQFMSEALFEVEGCEKAKYHPNYGYAGTPDLWGILGGANTLIDVKSGSPAKWHFLQLAAYWELLRADNYYAKQAAILYLDDKNKYRLSKVLSAKELKNLLLVFLSALTTNVWKRENL